MPVVPVRRQDGGFSPCGRAAIVDDGERGGGGECGRNKLQPSWRADSGG